MKQSRFLIARIDRIGDVVLSTPIPREIKKVYPNSYIAVLLREYTKDIYLSNPNVDEIIIYDKNKDGTGKTFWQLVKVIRKQKFNYAFMLLPQKRLNYILFFSSARIRIGVGHKLYQFLTFTKYINRKKYIPLRHEADYCLDMIRKIGINPESLHPEIYLSEEEKIKVKKIRKDFTQGKKIIGINVTSGNSAPNLNLDEYQDLIFLLKENPVYKVAVMDYDIPAQLDHIDGVIYPNKGNLLRNSIINFATLNVLISSSTGPMHICAALKIPTLSLFCPLTACSTVLWGPLGNKSRIIIPEQEYCATQCPIDPKKCDYSKPGGLRAKDIIKQLETFIS